jgi:hypothetical protein
MNSHAEVASTIDAIRMKQNYYVDVVLTRFIHEKLDAIDALAQKINLDPEKTIKLKNAFLNRISGINFMAAYGNKAFPRLTPNGFDLDYAKFSQYVLKQIPDLQDLQEFAAQELGYKNKKREILTSIGSIKKAVNAYSGQNKKSFIDKFNTEVDDLLVSLKDMPFLEVDAVAANRTKVALDNLQSRESTYYNQFTFFAASRKANSTLQPKINEAFGLLDKLGKPNGEAASHDAKPRISPVN